MTEWEQLCEVTSRKACGSCYADLRIRNKQLLWSSGSMPHATRGGVENAKHKQGIYGGGHEAWT